MAIFSYKSQSTEENLKKGLFMPWIQMVARGFGIADCIFAGHPIDKQNAKAAIDAAKAAGASFEDFEKEMVWHIYKHVTAPGVLQNHIAKQVATAKKMW
ncbi:hypothetical protein FHC77_00025 [Atlantibacter hermannii]|uniref:hypothetical protein n=1 Tax=Atlantibacter hermannii TaxID=565 RepID=UPI001C6FE0F6|nr:hypothetical protein [Atlantibacter hermannii]MBW9429152.1 hypothetical protein [Atlantibacter hermannii]